MRFFSLLTLSLCLTLPSMAWDYEGHRAVNQLALDALPADFPAFVRSPAAAERIAFLSGEPDRWRNLKDNPLRHLNNPDHYLNIEELEPYGLSLAQVSDLRYAFVMQMTEARLAHPERWPAIDPEKNRDRTRELPGFLPWAITENYHKLKSAFSYLKAFSEPLRQGDTTPAGTPEEIANAEANIITLMGVMGHYVGDAAQPLHTTKHFNGWVGNNPSGYTTRNTIHSWIDGGFLGKMGGVSPDKLHARLQPARRLTTTASADGRDPVFNQTVSYLLTQHLQVEPIYALNKAGRFSPESQFAPEGLTFLENQFLAGGHMLASLWLTAWLEAPTDTFLRAQLLKRHTGDVRPTSD